jgi:cytochrome P450
MMIFITTITIIIISVSIIILTRIIPKHEKRNPPMIGRLWLPFLGCAIPFNTNPPQYLKQMREVHGNIFTLHMAGRIMTYLFDAENFDIFFAPSKSNQIALQEAKDESETDAVSFDQGVQQFTARIFGIPKSQFLYEHGLLLTSVRTALSPNTSLPMYSQKFCDKVQHVLDCDMKQTVIEDLFETCSELMFWSAMHSLFGTSFFKNSKLKSFNNTGTDNEYISFRNMDKYFELAASGLIPHKLLSDFSKSKSKLVTLLKIYRDECNANLSSESSEETVFKTILRTLEKSGRSEKSESEWKDLESNHHLWGVALLWASQANSLPATFWTIVFLLTNEDCLQRVKREIELLINKKENRNETASKLFTPENLPYLTACVKEGIRLQSPGILIRDVTRPIKLSTTVDDTKKNYIIPKGHTLCISPYVVHRNKDVFQAPDKFYPDRWLIGDKKTQDLMRKNFLAFGRGQNLCPGMNFAMVEMVGFIAILLNKYPHIHIKDGKKLVPEADLTRMVGVPHPKTKVIVNLYR